MLGCVHHLGQVFVMLGHGFDFCNDFVVGHDMPYFIFGVVCANPQDNCFLLAQNFNLKQMISGFWVECIVLTISFNH